MRHSAGPTYRIHDTTGDDVGLIEHPAPNVEPGDVVILGDGREAVVTCRVAADGEPLAALLEFAVAPGLATLRGAASLNIRPA